MAELIGARNKITTGETKSGAAVSQATLQRMGGATNWCIENASSQIGDVVASFLSLTDFQALRSTKWVLINGADITGSDLAALTGNTTLPDMVDGGAPIQSDSDVNLEDTSSGAVLSHTHGIPRSTGLSQDPYGTYFTEGSNRLKYNVDTSSTGGSNNLAAGVKVNYFIKINN